LLQVKGGSGVLLERDLNGALTVAESVGRDVVGVCNRLVDDLDGVPGGRCHRIARRHAHPSPNRAEDDQL